MFLTILMSDFIYVHVFLNIFIDGADIDSRTLLYKRWCKIEGA